MDTYSSKLIVCKAPFDSEAAAKQKAILENYTNPWVRISVEGFRCCKDDEDEIRIELINLFKSCGRDSIVDFPREPLLDRRAFVTLRAHGDDAHVAKEKALQLNGSNMGGWNALVKIAPEEEDEEYLALSAYREALGDELLYDKRFMFGITVKGYDTSLRKDEVEKALRAHFSSCGEITHVYVNPADKFTNIYFSQEEGEASAMALDGSQVDRFKITTSLVATTASSNTPLPPGETYFGYCYPAHMLEFGKEMQEKIDFYMTEWRLNAMTKKLRALKKHKVWTLREPKVKALKKPKAGALKKLKAWALRKKLKSYRSRF
ncbi:Uncharacterized protein Rs2_17248 [Raphanus sativus]|uniref:Uncharacterized protein LOC108854153 n=1 Tax=Raphanus sativus TaxID=3726 RepID=A0A6J0NH65_RAPSA|nr:uncharacterized protein LOC108854153 [Raphanus sativus]KAJ4903297.1 Uncharacterized protein Rs2_17248 [Raphanus sativus]